MPLRIAIPMPHSIDHEYAERAILQYELAVEQAAAEPVRIPLDRSTAEVRELIERCDGVLLPGSNADVDPARFNTDRSPHSAAPDPRRDAADMLLLEDAYNLRKPILGICYGLQNLNVYRTGSLIQHIPDFLPQDLRTRVNHEAGKEIAMAHTVEIAGDSLLARILAGSVNSSKEFSSGITREEHDSSADDLEENGPSVPGAHNIIVPVNSSHHQSADLIGDGLSISARCPDDGIIEALEGVAPDHFVIAVQWHPERSVDNDKASRAIFLALVKAAQTRQK